MSAAFDSNVDLSIEMAFGHGALDETPMWTDVTAKAKAVQIVRGRSSVLGRFEAGVASILLDNRDGRFDPNNTGGTYSPNVKVGVPVRVQATHDATTYDLFRGVVESWPLEYPDKGKNSLVQVPCVDGFKLIGQVDISGGTYAQEATDVRIGNVLDDVDWPAGLRDLDDGLAQVQAFDPDGTNTALAHILDAAESEVGVFYLDGGGTAVFGNRVRFSGGPVSAGTFSPSGIPFSDVSVVYDDEFLWNDVRVTRDGGELQQATDATSITSNGRRVLLRDVMPNSNDPEAFDVATWLVAMFAEQEVRVRSLTLSPRSSPADLWPQVLGRELTDAVTVSFDPPTGDTFTQECVIQRIIHTFDAEKNWSTVWEVAPLSDLEQLSFWIFDTSTYDTSTVFA